MKGMNEMWSALGNALRPRDASGEVDCGVAGFRPAFLEFSTMHIYESPLLPGQRIDRRSLVAGFERGGFFYTRSAAARACQEWNLGR